MRRSLAGWVMGAFASAGLAQNTGPQLPNPVLTFTGTEVYFAGGKSWVRNRLDVVNKYAFPDALFAASPDLPPCGKNMNSSRTWVDIFDHKGKRMYGFCALKSAEELSTIWVATEVCTVPPPAVYIEFHDRLKNIKAKSNLADVKDVRDTHSSKELVTAEPAPSGRNDALLGPFMMFFEHGKPEIPPSARPILRNVAGAYYMSTETPFVAIAAFTDRTGSAAAHRKLSEHRAEEVRWFLKIQCGIPLERTSIIALAEQPIFVDTGDGLPNPQNRAAIIAFGSSPERAAEAILNRPATREAEGTTPPAAGAKPRWDEAEFQRKLEAHQQELERHRQSVAEYERQTAATEARKAELRAQAAKAKADWERRVAACRAGDLSQCSGSH